MLKLLNPLVAKPKDYRQAPEEARYTRFSHVKKTPAQPVASSAPTDLAQPMTRPTTARLGSQQDTVDLHVTAHVPVAVLRKALPMRFAKMRVNHDDFAHG